MNRIKDNIQQLTKPENIRNQQKTSKGSSLGNLRKVAMGSNPNGIVPHKVKSPKFPSSNMKQKLRNLSEQAIVKGNTTIFLQVLKALSPPEISGEVIERSLEEVISHHNKMIMNHSVIEGTARFATIRLYAIQLLEGQNIDSPLMVAVGKKDRWPSIFNEMRPLYYRVRDLKCKESDQIIRSILYINRLCKGNSHIDTAEITKTFEVPEVFIDRFRKFIKSDKSNYKMNLELVTRPTLKVVSSGPNSKPKWQTANIEAYALIHSEYQPHFYNLCIVTGNSDFYKYVEAQSAKLSRTDKVRLRYILSIPDKGNKSRVVAISDYWTQLLLKPLMEHVQKWIQDKYGSVCSGSNHSLGFDKLKKFIRPGVKSLDIKSWTDAHPSILQKVYLEELFGKELADAWYALVVSCEWEVKNSKESIKYGRGQGMGTNGSFDIATATDLLILEMIYKQDYNSDLSENLFNKVGDDLWCYDPKGYVSDTYTNIMGMEISIPKTKQAEEGNLCGEFVSRNLNWGRDVSRISPNICRAVRENIFDLPELFRHLVERLDGSEIRLDLEQIILSAGVKRLNRLGKDNHLIYLRTFYALTMLYPERPGMLFLRENLEKSYYDLCVDDEFIIYIKDTVGTERLRNSFYLYSGASLTKSIMEKHDLVSYGARKFSSPEEIAEFTDPAKWWLSLDESIEDKTSKMALSLSLISHRKLFDVKPEPEEAIANLEQADRSITFKDLGVISTDASPWRPTVSRLYNIIKSVSLHDPIEGDIETDISNNKVIGKQIFISIDMESPIMLPSVLEKYLALRGREMVPNDY